MTLPPFWGPVASTTQPDPLIWWVAAPIGAYILAILIAYMIADIMKEWDK